jgi:hypothetical protein
MWSRRRKAVAAAFSSNTQLGQDVAQAIRRALATCTAEDCRQDYAQARKQAIREAEQFLTLALGSDHSNQASATPIRVD